MKRPQVLVFIDWYTPGYKAGGPVRSIVNMVAHLHDEIDFHIVCSDTEYTEDQPYAGIIADQWTEGVFGERVFYVSSNSHRKEHWKALLTQENWDHVYVNGMYSPWYSAAPLWFAREVKVSKIVAPRGMLAPGPMAHSTLKKRLFLTVMKLGGAYRAVRFHVTNEGEAGQVRQLIGSKANTFSVPNLPKRVRYSDVPERTKEKGQLELISVARIAVEKNTLLAIKSLVHVKGKVRFHLYGPVYGDGYWAECQNAIESLPDNIQVLAHGPVAPDQTEEELLKAHVLFMPSTGENFGHSMLEALSSGLPLLISDRTPWRNLEDKRAGWDIPIDDPGLAQREFGKKLQLLVDMDQDQYNLWNAGAFKYGCKQLESEEKKQKYLELFRWNEEK
jgi:glycosyltransferase involved in cell wall biosynthesis